MQWVLVVYLFSTNNVTTHIFPSEKECRSAMIDLKAHLMDDPDVKKINCERGTVIEGN